jgi:two-component system cell cycle response regulator DivK
VLETGDDEEGLRLARSGAPDLILAELFPWSGGGRMFPERLQDAPETAGVPVIALTAHLLPDGWEETLGRCCRRVLVKPCGPLRLLEEVRRIL